MRRASRNRKASVMAAVSSDKKGLCDRNDVVGIHPVRRSSRRVRIFVKFRRMLVHSSDISTRSSEPAGIPDVRIFSDTNSKILRSIGHLACASVKWKKEGKKRKRKSKSERVVTVYRVTGSRHHLHLNDSHPNPYGGCTLARWIPSG